MWSERIHRFRKIEGFGQLLWKINCGELENFLYHKGDELASLQIRGLQVIAECFSEFFETSIDLDNIRIEVFTSVSLESTDIVRATNEFHKQQMFSNVIVSGSDVAAWFGLVS